MASSEAALSPHAREKWPELVGFQPHLRVSQLPFFMPIKFSADKGGAWPTHARKTLDFPKRKSQMRVADNVMAGGRITIRTKRKLDTRAVWTRKIDA